jgi:hypothetical protein
LGGPFQHTGEESRRQPSKATASQPIGNCREGGRGPETKPDRHHAHRNGRLGGQRNDVASVGCTIAE